MFIFQIQKLQYDGGTEMRVTAQPMELMQSQHTDGFPGSFLYPDSLKAPGAWEQQIALRYSRSVNLEFGFNASIYRNITLAQC